MYNVDYLQKLYELLVPDKRTASVIAFNAPLFVELQEMHNGLFTTYKEFQACADWDDSTTYTKGDLVKYQKAVHRSLSDGNGGNNPTTVGTVRWQLVSSNFFGVDNRIKIKGEKLILEYALNLWFGTTFRQPVEGLSDIRIENNTMVYQSPFKVGRTEVQSSSVSKRESTDFIGLDYDFAEKFGFTIKVPTSVFESIGSDDQIRENIIRDFADRYVACGIIYKIQTY